MTTEPWSLAGQVVLLSDTLRVDGYRWAIEAKVRPGDVVLDLGSGTGVMARFAALAGASRVIAIEDRLELCELNQHVNQLLGWDGVIEVVPGRAEAVRLEDRVDVVISELIGDLADDEGMSRVLSGFCAAHGERLAPGARFLPEEVSLFGRFVAGSEATGMMRGDDEELAAAMGRVLAGELRVLTHLDGVRTVGEPFRLLRVDGRGGRRGGRGEAVARFAAARPAELPRAMVCWFEARLADGVHLDSRGDGGVRTSWGLPLVPLVRDPTLARAGSAAAELRFALDRDERGELEVEARWVAAAAPRPAP